MTRGLLIGGLLTAASASVASAQTVVDVRIPQETRKQVQVFASALRTAVENATASLGERAREVVPDIRMHYQTALRVEGFILPTDTGFLFTVDPPLIDASSQLLFEVNRRWAPRSPLSNVNSGTGGSGSSERETAAANPVLMTDPIAEYSRFTYEAIVAAMLDNALALPVAEGQTLTVIVRTGLVAGVTNPMAPPERHLHLILKGEDLLALRQNRITRAQARDRIIEKRY